VNAPGGVVGPTDMRSFWLQKTNGQHVLMVWRDVKAWDYVTETSVTVPSVDATVSLFSALPWALYEPATQESSVAAGTGSTITVPLSAGLSMLVIG